MNFLRKLYLRIKYPDVCWKHRRMKSSYTYGFYCADCVSESSDNVQREVEERHRLLKERYGIKHGL